MGCSGTKHRCVCRAADAAGDVSTCECMRFTSVAKPEYFYQPLQLFRRLRAEFVPRNIPVRLRLPGGAEFVAPGADHIAQAILHLGVFDLVVTEALWRLIEPGDVAVDAGA